MNHKKYRDEGNVPIFVYIPKQVHDDALACAKHISITFRQFVTDSLQEKVDYETYNPVDDLVDVETESLDS